MAPWWQESWWTASNWIQGHRIPFRRAILRLSACRNTVAEAISREHGSFNDEIEQRFHLRRSPARFCRRNLSTATCRSGEQSPFPERRPSSSRLAGTTRLQAPESDWLSARARAAKLLEFTYEVDCRGITLEAELDFDYSTESREASRSKAAR